MKKFFSLTIIVALATLNALALGPTAVSPNPTTGVITVQLASDQDLGSTLSVFNIIGEEVTEHRVTLESTKTTINLSSLPAGVYIVKITSKGGAEIAHRISKQ